MPRWKTMLHRLFPRRIDLETAIEQAAEAVLITDPEGTILYVNPAFERMTGWTRDEAVGRTPRILKSGAHGPEFYREMWAALTAGEVWTARFTNRRKNGEVYEEDQTIAPVRDEAGRTVGYVSVKRDISREVALEAQLRQAQKMESIGLLTGGIAHDFNNMLTAIIGSSDLLLMDLEPDDPQREQVEEIGQVGRRAARLCRQLLEISRPGTAEPRPTNLNRVICEMERLLRRVIGADVALTTDLAADLGDVTVTPGHVEQVILNLAVNARDAMPEGGELGVATANVELGAGNAADAGADLTPGPYVVLRVTDNGVGMDETTRAHAFEPFYTTKQQGRGTGLGLSTVRDLLRSAGGGVRIESEPGRGATFEIHLPRSD